MVVGEPGIGKTALCEQLATYVAMRGGKTLVGHTYEEGSLSLPYLPFIEALRTYVLPRDPEGLKQDLGSGAAEVARIVSEVRDRVPVELRSEGRDPDEDRWRLYEAVGGFLRNASTVQPLLVMLEDLHWADRGTLDLLVFIARQLQGVRLLLVGNYRDVEVDRTHHLSGALADLRRSASFQRIPLRGLTVDEVQRMLSTIAGQSLPWSLAEAVHRQTEGNPLFVQEVLRYLAEEGLMQPGGDQARRGGDTPLELQIPEGLRDVIGKRLSRLSPECNRILTLASVIGRDFTLATLEAVAEGTEEQVIAALEEAVRVGVLEDQSRAGLVRFRFAHAFFRQTLYEEIFTPRRLRLHQQVARALERQYATRLEEHAAELAEHFSQSTDAEDLRKAVRYGELAAQRATAVYAYGEAVRHLERALLAQEVFDPDDRARRCDLLLALAEALGPAGEPQRVFETVADEAYALNEAAGNRRNAARACAIALDALLRFGGGSLWGSAMFRRWAERADRTAPADSLERVYADIALARVYASEGAVAQAAAHFQAALGVARDNGDPETILAAAAGVLGSSGSWRVNDLGKLDLIARDVYDNRIGGGSIRPLAGVLYWGAVALLRAGDRLAGEALAQRLADLAERTRDPSAVLGHLDWLALRAMLEGELEASVAVGEQILARGEELGSSVAAHQQATRGAAEALVYLGRIPEALRVYHTLLDLAPTMGSNIRARADLWAATAGGDPQAVDRLRARLQAMSSKAPDDRSAGLLTFLLQASLFLEDRVAAAELIPQLQPLAGTALLGGTGFSAAGRHLGAAAVLLDDRAAARGYYETSLEATARIRHRPEQALTHLQFAELLLTGDAAERREAQAHLDVAIDELRAMKMQPSLERALRHKGLLHA